MLVAFVLALLVGAARRADRALAQAARRRRARAPAAPGRWPRRSASACRRPRPGSCAPSARACSGASATRSRSRSSRTSRGCRRRSRPSRTTSGPTISIGSSVLRNQVFVLDHMYMSLFSTVRLDPAARRHGRAARVDPPGAGAARRVRAADGAHVDVAARRRARGAGARRAVDRGWRGTSSRSATTAPPGKEVRVTGIGERLVARAARGVGALVRAGRGGALGIGGVAHAGVGDLRRRLRRRDRVRRRRGSASTPGDVLLVLAAGARLSAYIGATVGEIGFLRGIWMDGSRRLAWLEDYAASLDGDGRPAGARRAARRASASSTSRSPIPAPSASCSTTCR